MEVMSERVSGKATVVATVFIIFLLLLVFTSGSGKSQELAASRLESRGSALAPEQGAAAKGGLWLSPAAALTDEKPVLLLFLPYEMCRIRYCPQPQLVAERLAQQRGDQVKFVPVTVYAIQDKAATDQPIYRLDNWDLYLVPPYDTWLPALTQTHFGKSLAAPVFTLVNGRRAVVSQGYNFPDIGRLVKAD